MNKAFYDLIYLCGCAVNEVRPDANKVCEMDMEQLYKLSKFHTLTAITAFALESCGTENNEFKQAKEKAIRKNMFLDNERMKLFNHLEQNGIWYMPLKGSILKNLYPQYGMRQMADNDILFDLKYRSAVKEYFQANGYKIISYAHENHDIYEKLPVLNFEMHTSLFGKHHDKKCQEYYGNIKSKLVKDEVGNFGYHFFDEDFYIYITMHEYKHYSEGGTGLRSLLDRYVFLQKKSETLGWKYIESECEKLGIADFEKQSRVLAEKVFGTGEKAELTEEDKRMLEKYLNSGTYGTLESLIKSNMEKYAEKSGKASKINYAVNRLFPDKEWYEAYKPFYNRHSYLKPFFVLFRFFRGVFFRRNKVMVEFRVLRK